MDIDTPSSPPPGPQSTPASQAIQPATPLTKHTALPSSPDLLSSIHAPTLENALRPRTTTKRTNSQADPSNHNSQPFRLRPTPNTDTASKLQQARTLMEEVYHTQGIDKQEAGLALSAIDNIRRACGYPHLGSSRDPWPTSQSSTTSTIQHQLNSLRQDLDHKFNTLATPYKQYWRCQQYQHQTHRTKLCRSPFEYCRRPATHPKQQPAYHQTHQQKTTTHQTEGLPAPQHSKLPGPAAHHPTRHKY